MSPEKHKQRIAIKARLEADERLVASVFDRRERALLEWAKPVFNEARLRAGRLLRAIASDNAVADRAARFADPGGLIHLQADLEYHPDGLSGIVMVASYHGERTRIRVPADPTPKMTDKTASSIERAVDVAIANFAGDAERDSMHWLSQGRYFNNAADPMVHPEGGYVWAHTFHPLVARELARHGWPHGPLPSHVKPAGPEGSQTITSNDDTARKGNIVLLGGNVEERGTGSSKREHTTITLVVPASDTDPGALSGTRLVDILPLQPSGVAAIDDAVAALMISGHERTWPAERQFPTMQSYRLAPARHVQARGSESQEINAVAIALARIS